MSQPRVLIIDDDHSFAQFAQYLISMLGYGALIALEGDDGIVAAKKEKPDVVLVDASMRRCSGIDVIRSLKSDPATCAIPIILCSITKTKRQLDQAFAEGAFEFLPKPLDPKELKARLEEALGRSR